MGPRRLLHRTVLAFCLLSAAAPPGVTAAQVERAGPPPQAAARAKPATPAAVPPKAPAVAGRKPAAKPVAKAPARLPEGDEGGGAQVRVGQASGLSRIELVGMRGIATRRDGQDIYITLPASADPDLSRLKTAPTTFVKAVRSSRTPAGIEIKVTLAERADAKVGAADGATYVNLFTAAAPPPALAETAPEAPTVRADPRPASGVVKVEAHEVGGQLLLKFPWANPAGAAVFRRGEALWIVFDTPARLDTAMAPDDGIFFKSMRAVQGAEFTALRIALPSDAVVHALGEGNSWTVVLGPGTQPRGTLVKIARAAEAGPATLQAAVAGSTKAVWIDDPVVGDRIAAVAALAPSKGMPSRREFVDLAILPSMQGLAVEPIAEDVQVAVEGELVRIGRPGGLTLSSLAALGDKNRAGAGLPQPAVMPGVIDFRRWSKTGSGGFMGRYGALQDFAAEEVDRQAKGDKSAGVEARMALARFLIGSELSFETIGVLDMLARTHPEMLDDGEFRGLRGAAKVMAGRYKEAQIDFSAPVLSDDPSSALWRGYVYAKLGQWKDARDNFQKGLPALNFFAAPWQAKMAREDARSALVLGDLRVAKTQIALALTQSKDPNDQLATYLVMGRLLEAEGSVARALNVYDAVSRAPSDELSAPALMHATRIRLQQGKLEPVKAAAIFDGLRYRWRGDATELEVIRSLGGLYLSQGRYREALEVLRSAGQRMPDSPEAVQLQADLQAGFRALFLDGRADGLEPVQALALFYDFRELTPIGGDGDLMVRKLARRLVDVDLLDKAAELLKYQADNRLDGVPKAQVATDLATIYLMDRKPEAALEAINASRTTVLPVQLALERRLIEARAWLALNRVDNALELIGKDASPDAQDMRADIAWRAKDWPAAGAAYEKALGERWKGAGPLAPDQESKLLRAGIAYSLAADEAALNRLRVQYQPLVETANAPDALKVALTAFTSDEPVRPSTFTRLAAQDDAFAGWVDKMKRRFKEKPAPLSGAKPKLAEAATGAAG